MIWRCRANVAEDKYSRGIVLVVKDFGEHVHIAAGRDLLEEAPRHNATAVR